LLRDAGERGQPIHRVRNFQARDRTPQQRGDVSVAMALYLMRRLSQPGVRTRSHPLSRRNQQIVSVHGERARVPVGRNQSDIALFLNVVVVCGKTGNIEYPHGIDAGVGNENVLAIFRLRQRRRTKANRSIFLAHGSG
jgi:predicted secreted protein